MNSKLESVTSAELLSLLSSPVLGWAGRVGGVVRVAHQTTCARDHEYYEGIDTINLIGMMLMMILTDMLRLLKQLPPPAIKPKEGESGSPCLISAPSAQDEATLRANNLKTAS